MKQITSLQNPQIKHLVKLQNSKYRKQHNQFIAQGINSCKSLINSKIKLIELYCTDDSLNNSLEIANENQVTIVTDLIMKKINPVTTSSDILCLFEIPQEPSKDRLTAGIVLANITDPGNMGTLIRTAAAMNVKSVIIIDGTDPWSAKVIHSTAGTIGNINVFQWSWNTLVQNKKNLKLCALVVKNGKPIQELKDENILLVVGNESQGIPQDWLAQCDQKITIPMNATVESLNAAVAGSIAMYLIFGK